MKTCTSSAQAAPVSPRRLTFGTDTTLGAAAGLSWLGCRGAMGGRFSGGRSLDGGWLAAPARRPVSTREETARGRLLAGGAAPAPYDTSESTRGRFTGAICRQHGEVALVGDDIA